jgi:hypothetical protein
MNLEDSFDAQTTMTKRESIAGSITREPNCERRQMPSDASSSTVRPQSPVSPQAPLASGLAFEDDLKGSGPYQRAHRDNMDFHSTAPSRVHMPGLSSLVSVWIISQYWLSSPCLYTPTRFPTLNITLSVASVSVCCLSQMFRWHLSMMCLCCADASKSGFNCLNCPSLRRFQACLCHSSTRSYLFNVLSSKGHRFFRFAALSNSSTSATAATGCTSIKNRTKLKSTQLIWH